MSTPKPDRIMAKLKAAFEESGMSLEELGRHMGYDEGAARRSAWQFLNKTSDPRLSMVLRCVSALGVELQEVLVEG